MLDSLSILPDPYRKDLIGLHFLLYDSLPESVRKVCVTMPWQIGITALSMEMVLHARRYPETVAEELRVKLCQRLPSKAMCQDVAPLVEDYSRVKNRLKPIYRGIMRRRANDRPRI